MQQNLFSIKLLIYGLAILLLGAGIFGTIYYVKYENKIEEYKAAKDSLYISQQNENALEDQLTQVVDSVQNLSLFVDQLTNNLIEEKRRYNILLSNYSILLDSISVIDSGIVTIQDSVIRIDFSGIKGKVTYDGWTKYFVETREGTYSVNIKVDPIKVQTEVYADSNNIIKQRIWADGQLITDAITKIDSSVFLLLKNNEINVYDPGFLDKLHLSMFLSAQQDLVDFGIGIGYPIGDFDLNWYYLPKLSVNQFQLNWNPSIKNVINLIIND